MNKIKCDIQGGVLSIDIMDVFYTLTEEQRKAFLETYTFEETIAAIERQLRHETGINSFCVSGDRDGSMLRAAIIKIQGLEPEYKKDLESKINSLESSVDHYKKYYDWYFKVYHLDIRDNEESIITKLHRMAGNPTNENR
jgi:hypothetical protein